jgi:hypothetical protein
MKWLREWLHSRRRYTILLIDYDGDVTTTKARNVGGAWVARRMSLVRSTDVILLPGGEVKGMCYVKQWFGRVEGMKGAQP